MTGLRESVAVRLAVAALAVGVLSFASGATVAQAQSVPSPWTGADIGRPAAAGSSSSSDGRAFQIVAGGSDIWGTADQFHFVYRAVTGDVDVIARVDSVTQAHAWSKAGVMIRGSLAAGAAHGYTLASAAKGLAFQRRTATGGLSTNTSLAGAPPRWVRLLRQGTTLTSYVSTNGTSWTTLARDTIGLGATAYVGLAVTSHAGAQVTSAALSQVSVVPLGIPAPYQSADIGNPALRGRAGHAAGVFTIDASGRDIWDASDQFHFVHRQVTGDVNIRARVSSLEGTHRWTKAAVMIRASLAADAPNAVALVSRLKGYSFQRRVTPGAWTDFTAGGTGTAPGWLRLVRSGDSIEAFRSANGTTWTSMGTDVVPMGATVYVGLAFTNHDVNAMGRGVFDNVTVTTTTPAPNQPPTASITSPASGATFTAPAAFTVTANASDPENELARVEFTRNGTLVGTDTTAPYSLALSGVPAGTHTLVATAWDADGLSHA